MLSASRLRDVHAAAGVDGVVRELGYAVEPIPVDPDAWRRAGIALPWNGQCRLTLLARMRRFDLFRLDGSAPPEAIAEFLRSYGGYNVLTKSAIFHDDQTGTISIYDLSQHKRLRRLDVRPASASPHALDRLNLLAAGDGASMTRVFDLALDREGLTRRFFQAFRAATVELAGCIGAACRGERPDAVGSQAVLFMSRLLFLSFVQEKGWLNGERRFLFDRVARRDSYRSVLRPLFFGCLNTPRDRRTATARKLGRIPYLNGGLFEPSAFERRNGDLDLPDEILRRIVEGLFARFDFSTDEDDLAGTHVDPEMLGKVFESLMASGERIASGTFYTPREIVDVLTERAIREWLGEGTASSRLERLETITVLDAACGSGAFLLSALGAIERLIRENSAELGRAVPPTLRQSIVERSLYGVDLKPEAVRLCELRLWLAIVSTAEYEIEEVPPLPNLDRNILQGNALFSPTDFLGDGRSDVYREWIYALRAQRDLIRRYRTAPREERPALARLMRDGDRRLASDLLARAIETDEQELQHVATPQRDLFGNPRPVDRERCSALQRRISDTRRALEKIDEGTLDFFSFDIHFAPVLASGGFDVVLGNPPWVRNARIEPRVKRMLSERYETFRPGGEHPAFHQPDVAVAFVERSLALASPGGVVSMLVPAKIANAAYAAPLRRLLLRHDVVALDDWSTPSRRYFDANTFPMGITIARRPPVGSTSVRDGDLRFTISRSDLARCDEWELVPVELRRIFDRMRREHPPLAVALGRQPIMGVKTGGNQAFFLGDATLSRAHLVTAEGISIPLRHAARCVRGRDVGRWRAAASLWMVWPPAGGWTKPPQWLERLAGAREVEVSDYSLAYVRPEHVGIKVAWKDVSRGMAAVVLPDSVDIGGHSVPLVPNQTLYCIDATSLDEGYAISALLNSTVAGSLLLAGAERAKDAHFRYFGRTVARLPLPRVPPQSAAWVSLVRLARRGHRGEDVGGEVDVAVSELYGISESELATLAAFVRRRLERDAC